MKETVTREITLTKDELKQKLGIPAEDEISNMQMWIDYQGFDCPVNYRFVYKQEINNDDGS